MNLLLFGPPGAGKGTQSELLRDRMKLNHISTGNLFRKALKEKTRLGIEAQKYFDSGDLVPDEVTIGLVREVLSGMRSGFILDGFPRNFSQVQALERILQETSLKIDKSLFLVVPESSLVTRLSGRRVCLKCGATYHVQSHPTKVKGKCDKCNGEVVQRADDQVEVIQKRLDIYRNTTAPIEEYYRASGKMVEIDGLGTAEEVFSRIQLSLSKVS